MWMIYDRVVGRRENQVKRACTLNNFFLLLECPDLNHSCMEFEQEMSKHLKNVYGPVKME